MWEIIKNILSVILKKEVENNADILPFNKESEENDLIDFEAYITASDKYPERLSSPELTQEKVQNAYKLIKIINPFLKELGITEVEISSGFRTEEANKKAGGASVSTHMQCLAVDLKDDGTIRDKILANLDIAQKYGVFFENFDWTNGWTHCQIVPPKSGKRIFIPNSNPASAPGSWSGEYDKKFDN